MRELIDDNKDADEWNSSSFRVQQWLTSSDEDSLPIDLLADELMVNMALEDSLISTRDLMPPRFEGLSADRRRTCNLPYANCCCGTRRDERSLQDDASVDLRGRSEQRCRTCNNPCPQCCCGTRKYNPRPSSDYVLGVSSRAARRERAMLPDLQQPIPTMLLRHSQIRPTPVKQLSLGASSRAPRRERAMLSHLQQPVSSMLLRHSQVRSRCRLNVHAAPKSGRSRGLRWKVVLSTQAEASSEAFRR